jgi:hypothetical protein
MTLDYAPLQRDLPDIGYIADKAMAMALRLMIGLRRPLLLEGEAVISYGYDTTGQRLWRSSSGG